MTFQSGAISELFHTQIYSVEDNAPDAREGAPTYGDLVYHSQTQPDRDEPTLCGRMTYTGDYGKVFCSHKIYRPVSSLISVTLLNPPQHIGSGSQVYSEVDSASEKVMTVTSYLLSGEAGLKRFGAGEKEVAIFKAFVDQESARLSKSAGK